MYVDGVATGHKLWMSMHNEVTPDYRDGIVRWGTTAPVVVDPDINIVTVYAGQPEVFVPDGGTTSFRTLRLTFNTNNVPFGSLLELWDGETLLGIIPDSLEYTLQNVEYGQHAFVARVVSSQSVTLATSNVWDIDVTLPTPTISAILANYTPTT
jgi:hypothetical protein